jgi:hypothetical protein
MKAFLRKQIYSSCAVRVGGTCEAELVYNRTALTSIKPRERERA